MKPFLLDTNVLSEFSRVGPPHDAVARWLQATSEALLFASVLTFAEIRRGIELLPASRRRAQLELWQHEFVASFAGRLLPVTLPIAERWAVLSADSKRRGTPLATIDGLLAATASEHGLTVATRNVKDFANLGIAIFNPWDN